MFGLDFFKNAIMVFTKFSYDQKSIRDRNNNRKITEERAIKEYTQHFKSDFQFSPDRSQFCLIDNGVDKDPDASDFEKEMYEKSFKHIKEFVKGNQAFFCKDIKEVLKEKDALLKKIKENEEKSLKERALYIAVQEKKHKEEIEKMKAEQKAKELKERAEREK